MLFSFFFFLDFFVRATGERNQKNKPSSPSTAIAFCFIYSVRKAPMLALSAARDSEGSADSVEF